MQFDSKFKWSGDIEFDFRTTLQSCNRKIHCYLLKSYITVKFMEIIYIFSNITFVASYVEVWEKWLISGLSQAGGLA